MSSLSNASVLAVLSQYCSHKFFIAVSSVQQYRTAELADAWWMLCRITVALMGLRANESSKTRRPKHTTAVGERR
jgi:hypothetical protein